MEYKIRKGAVLEQVGDAFLIVTSDEARPPCPYIRQVNATIAFYWRLLEEGLTDSAELLQAAEKEFAAPTALLKNDLQQLLDHMEALGYLIKVQD